MLHPQQRIQARTIEAARRIPAARQIRRSVDTGRVRTILQSETYAMLLRIEVAADEARDALRVEDNAAAALIVREILTGACLAARGLQRLRALR
jgi:hypothetical protein